MFAYRIVWEDEANAREVEIFVDYTLQAGVVQVEAIRPTKVTLYDAARQQVARVLEVWTETGRRVLTRAYLTSRDSLQTLSEEIRAEHALRDEAFAAEAAL